MISTYLIIHSSFLLIEEIYSIFIPWLRKLCIFGLIIRLPGIGFWIAAIYMPGAKAIGPVLAAIVWEYLCPLIIDSSLADRLTPIEYKRALDVNHFQSRMANFFVIVLGEGVLQLIKNGPLGRGLNATTGSMAFVLVIYYAFSFLYFVRDGSKMYIPAVRHKGWRFLTFVFWHIPLFAALLSFVASVMFILQHQYERNDQQNQETLSEEEIQRYLYRAIWTCATSLAIINFSMLVLALLDQPLDKPGTLRVDNRYIRLAGRIVYIIIILCVPSTPHLSPSLFLGIAGIGVVFLTIYEWNACLERGGGFIEPRGLTLMMNRELKGKKPVAVPHGDVEDHHKFNFRSRLSHS